MLSKKFVKVLLKIFSSLNFFVSVVVLKYQKKATRNFTKVGTCYENTYKIVQLNDFLLFINSRTVFN